MLDSNRPAVILAPMDGITDAPMRALQGELGGFSFAVSEFIRVSQEPLPQKVFRREVPELLNGGLTPTGLPVQVQILGGHPGRMAQTAINAVKAGAQAIDINFGCPAPTVNRNDGGATLLNHPCRIREIVAAVREAAPMEIPVSAKVRLGWDCVDAIYANAEMAAEGGASWLTIHARTRVQGYNPPVFWKPIGVVHRSLGIPVVANGDIWNLDDFHRCQDETGCTHYMLGRSALANPELPNQIARELGLPFSAHPVSDWTELLQGLARWTSYYESMVPARTVLRFKQWMNLAAKHGRFQDFDAVKRTSTVQEFLNALSASIAHAA